MIYINGETISIIVFFLGFFGLVYYRKIIKSIICIGIMDVAVIIYFISANYNLKMMPPLHSSPIENFADPLPQALMITAIVIGVGVTAVSITMYIHLFRKYGEDSWDEIMKKRKEK